MGEMIDIGSGPSGAVSAYLAEPVVPLRGGLLVIHEVWGLVDHITDVADRFADVGYLTIAPDLLTGLGVDVEVAAALAGEMADPELRSAAQPRMRELMSPMSAPGAAETILAGARACVDFLVADPEVAGRIGVVGYCFGGTYAFWLAAADTRLRAVVPYYGRCDLPVSELARITAPVLAFYGAEDEGLVRQLPQLRQAMRDAGVDFRSEVYPGAGHAFFNDANPVTYDEAAADDAWQQTLEHLDRHLTVTRSATG